MPVIEQDLYSAFKVNELLSTGAKPSLSLEDPLRDVEVLNLIHPNNSDSIKKLKEYGIPCRKYPKDSSEFYLWYYYIQDVGTVFYKLPAALRARYRNQVPLFFDAMCDSTKRAEFESFGFKVII